MVKISTENAVREIRRLRAKLGPEKVAKAERMAINDTLRSARPAIAKEIRKRYNIPSRRIYDKDKKKGLLVRLATNANLRGQITGGHIPVNFASLDGTRLVSGEGKTKMTPSTLLKRRANAKRTKPLFVSVEVVKGIRKTIQTAFVLGVTPGQKGAKGTGEKPAIFARGIYGKPSFAFSKPRMPISSLSTSSVATAALYKTVQREWADAAQRKAAAETVRQLQRLADNM